MSGGIFLIQNDGQLVEMNEELYDSEDLLQTYLEKYPNLLAGDQINQNNPRKWLLIDREVGVPCQEGGNAHWSVDHLFLDQDAIPTIVEVKRSSDSRIRREVVGQMLDYAANAVVYWPIENIRSQYERYCENNGINPDDNLNEIIGHAITTDEFWQKAKTNLQAGKVRLLFVADEIPFELRRIVEFLNQQMDPAEVLALEIKQYMGEGLKTMVPNVIGQTAEAQQRKGSTSQSYRQWNEESFFEELQTKHADDIVSAARMLLEWSTEKGFRIWWGRGKTMGSFVPEFYHNGTNYPLFAVYTTESVEIYFQWYQYKEPFKSIEKRLEFLEILNLIPGVSISQESITKRPSIPLSILANKEVLKMFFDAFEWFINEAQAFPTENIETS